MGMLATILHTPITNMIDFFLTYRAETLEKKIDRLIQRGINKTFVIYAPNNELNHIWSAIVTNKCSSLVKMNPFVLIINIYCLVHFQIRTS